jgi:nucleoid DNA-binding protein
MTKQQFIDSVARVTGQSKAEVETMLDTAAQALASGERIEFRGFGIFAVKETKARTGRNPRTGEAVSIAASRKVSFRPSKELKDRLTAPAVRETQA